MQPKRTIFDSESERELFRAIDGSWEPDHKLYPHLPFENLMDLDPQRFQPGELNFLHKTTVDYVLTTAEDRPLLAIEFDGLGHGYIRDGRYIQRVPTRDPNRSWKLDLKCRAADLARFPFAVISYEEKAVVDPEVNLIVAHGIIGSFLAHGHASQLMQEYYAQEREFIESLPNDEQFEYVEDYVIIPAEVEADMAMNPLARRTSELEKACREAGVIINGHKVEWPDDEAPPPEADPSSGLFDPVARLSWLDKRKRIGATVTLLTVGAEYSQTAWVRNMTLPGTAPLGLAQDIAHLLAARSALEAAQAPRNRH